MTWAKEYISTLDARLKDAGISYSTLAAEIGRLTSRKKESVLPQLSRWINGYVVPRLDSVHWVEQAMANLTKKDDGS